MGTLRVTFIPTAQGEGVHYFHITMCKPPQMNDCFSLHPQPVVWFPQVNIALFPAEVERSRQPGLLETTLKSPSHLQDFNVSPWKTGFLIDWHLPRIVFV